MDPVKPRYSDEEFARRGDTIFENDIRPKLSSKDVGKFLAIDIEAGVYEISISEMRAGKKLRARLPQSQIWMVRGGYTTTHSFGGGLRRDNYDYGGGLSLTRRVGTRT